MEASTKLVKLGKALDIIGKILAVICLLAATGALVSVIVVILIPEESIHALFNQLEIATDFFVPGTTLGDFFPTAALFGFKLALILGISGALLYFVVGAVILFILSALFKSTVTKRSPFLPENVKRLKIIGVILIVISIVLGLQNLIFAFCFLALAFMFQYGTELQQQADETL